VEIDESDERIAGVLGILLGNGFLKGAVAKLNQGASGSQDIIDAEVE